MHSLRTVADCDEAEERVRVALREYILERDQVGVSRCHDALTEITEARVALIPSPRKATE